MKNRVIYTFQEDLAKRLKDPEFKEAWEESEVEYKLAVNLIEERLKKKMSRISQALHAKLTISFS